MFVNKIMSTGTFRLDASLHFDGVKQDVAMALDLVGLMSHRQRGYLETAPPFTVPCEGREAR